MIDKQLNVFKWTLFVSILISSLKASQETLTDQTTENTATGEKNCSGECNTTDADSANICEYFKDCQCKTKSIINCENSQFSAEFSFIYYQTPNGTCAKFEALHFERGDLNSVLQFIVNITKFHHKNVSTFTMRNFCNPTSINQTLDLSPISNLHELVQLNVQENCIREVFNTQPAMTITHLDLSYNQLQKIPDKLGLPHLQTLNLTSNQIKIVESKDFHQLTELRKLILAANNLTSLKNDFFRNDSNLRELNLDDNKFSVFPENGFDNLNHLLKLSLRNNKIKTISERLFQKLTNLKVLDLSTNQLRDLNNAFKNLKNLEILNLERNEISNLEQDIIENLRRLNVFNLNNNKFTTVPRINQNSFSLSLYLANNNISTLHLPLTNRIPKSELLDLSGNCIQQTVIETRQNHTMEDAGYKVFKCINCCLSEINPELMLSVHEVANLSHNCIPSINMDDLNLFVTIEEITVDLSYNNITSIEVEWYYPLIGEYKEDEFPNRNIIVDHNPIACDCYLLPTLEYVFLIIPNFVPNEHIVINFQFDISDLYCASPPHLKNKRVLNLKTQNLVCDIPTTSGCPDPCRCLYVPYDLVEVNCSGQNLTIFPDLNATIHKFNNVRLLLPDNMISSIPDLPDAYWNKIVTLNLSRNQITTIANLKASSKLRQLNLDGNLLQKVETPLISVLNANATAFLSLSGNPWKCDCQLLSVRKLLSSSRIGDSDNITCVKQDKPERVLFLTNVSEQELCMSMFKNPQLLAMQVAIPLALITALLFSVVVVLRCFEKEIKLWLFTRGLCLNLVTDKEDEPDMDYDAFVSYSNRDDDWVSNVLVKGLETGIPPYSLCLHERDWPGGEWIPNQIARSVKRSRRTIVVLSDNFIQSYWSRLEFQAAYQQMLSNNIHRVLVVVPNELPPIDDLDEHLRTFISINTYIRWDKPYFWRKLRCAMPRVKHEPNFNLELTNQDVASSETINTDVTHPEDKNSSS